MRLPGLPWVSSTMVSPHLPRLLNLFVSARSQFDSIIAAEKEAAAAEAVEKAAAAAEKEAAKEVEAGKEVEAKTAGEAATVGEVDDATADGAEDAVAEPVV